MTEKDKEITIRIDICKKFHGWKHDYGYDLFINDEKISSLDPDTKNLSKRSTAIKSAMKIASIILEETID
jgi:hypothetical protein